MDPSLFHLLSPYTCRRDPFVPYSGSSILRLRLTRGGYGMVRRSPPRNVTYFEPVPPRFARTPSSSPPSRSAAASAAARRSGICGCHSPRLGWITTPGSSWLQSTRIDSRSLPTGGPAATRSASMPPTRSARASPLPTGEHKFEAHRLAAAVTVPCFRHGAIGSARFRASSSRYLLP
jgi:hypothetical protein